MTERPILFSSPMVRAILAGSKTQTRRVVKLDTLCAKLGGDLARAFPDLLWGVTPGLKVPCTDGTWQRLRNPWGFPEPSRLWVRETWAEADGRYSLVPIAYRADGDAPHLGVWKWRSPLFMPRWASRILLDVTDVRVERLQDLSGEDARSEGIEVPRCSCEPCVSSSTMCTADAGVYVEDFAHLWDSINGKRAPWSSNPFVWVVSFRRVEA